MRTLPRLASVLFLAAAACASVEPQARPPRQRVPGPALAQRQDPWMNDRGEAVTLSSLAGSTVVLGAFYARCTKTCPLTVDKLRAVDEAFQRAGRKAEVVLVTIDPERDTAQALARYRAHHHLPEGWHLLRGSPEQTEALTELLDIHVADLDAHLFHGSRVLVVEPGGAAGRSFRCCDFDPATAVP